MATGKITANTVNALETTPDAQKAKAAKRDFFLWDDKLAGFGVKLTPTGRKVYIVQYRQGGRGTPQRHTIGREGSPWRPQSARDRAEELLRQAGSGVDLRAVAKQKSREATDLKFSAYLKTFADSKLKVDWPKSWQEAKRCLELHALPHWKDKALPAITRADVERALGRLDSKPATRRNLYAVLSYLFNKAVKAGDLDKSPLAGVDAPPMVAERAHTLDHDELRWLWISTFDLPEPYGPIFRLFALLGQRRGEVGGMDWRELNRKAGEWHIPAARAKNGTDTIVPLPSSAVAMLDAVAKGDKWPRQGLVFPSGKGTAPSGWSKVKRLLDAKVAKAAKVDGASVRPWRTHDLRRTLATNLQALGTPFEVVEHLLNHKERTRTGIGKVYQTHGFKAEKRLALDRWETELARIVNGEAQTVVPLRASA